MQRGERVSNEIRCPIHVDDLAKAIIEVGQSDYKGILHIAGPRSMSRFEELQMFVRWRGISEELIGSDLLNGKNRPLNCSLNIDRFRKTFSTYIRVPEEYWKIG